VAGTHTVTGTYSGSGSHLGSGSSGFALTVNKRTISVSISCAPVPGMVGTSTTCTATVTDTDVGTKSLPSGTVSFASSGAGTFLDSPCTLAPVGPTEPFSSQCAVTYTPSMAGVHTITASYSGSATHLAADGSYALTVIPFDDERP
jgi:hypothetical protein